MSQLTSNEESQSNRLHSGDSKKTNACQCENLRHDSPGTSAGSPRASRAASRCGTIMDRNTCRIISRRRSASSASKVRPAFVRAPEGNGCAERLIRTLKENLLWVRHFETIEELRLALLAFREV